MSKRYDAFAITQGKEDKSYWHKCGVAFENRDGSLNVQLFALPVDGKFQLRVPKEREPEAGVPAEREPGQEG